MVGSRPKSKNHFQKGTCFPSRLRNVFRVTILFKYHVSTSIIYIRTRVKPFYCPLFCLSFLPPLQSTLSSIQDRGYLKFCWSHGSSILWFLKIPCVGVEINFFRFKLDGKNLKIYVNILIFCYFTLANSLSERISIYIYNSRKKVETFYVNT